MKYVEDYHFQILQQSIKRVRESAAFFIIKR